MNKNILGIILITLIFGACNNPYEKEISEVDELIAMINETEELLLSLDTSKVFGTKRLLVKDIAEFSKIGDTLTREEAFKIGDYFGAKKKFYRLTAGYPKFINQIEVSKKQLNDLKQDLENGLIKKENYTTYYKEEYSAVKGLGVKINKLIINIDVVVEKYETDRPYLLSFIEKLKQKSTANE